MPVRKFPLQVRVGSGGRLRTRLDKVASAEHEWPVMPHSTFLEVSDERETFRAFHSFEGGRFWRPTVRQLGHLAGGETVVRVVLLTPSAFLSTLPDIVFDCPPGYRWGPRKSKVSQFHAAGRDVSFELSGFAGSNAPEVITIRGILDEGLANSNGQPRLAFTVNGLHRGSKRFAFYIDDTGSAKMGIGDGRQFRRIRFAWFDGVRLRILYARFRGYNVAILYLRDPAQLYRINEEVAPDPFCDMRCRGWFQVKLRRELESRMLAEGSSYDHGRLGVEIACSILKKLLPNCTFSIPEISRGGRDLYSDDGRISVQARLIYDFRQFRPIPAEEAVKSQLTLLCRKLGQDFAYNVRMHEGFACLSFFWDDDSIHTILLQSERGPTK